MLDDEPNRALFRCGGMINIINNYANARTVFFMIGAAADLPRTGNGHATATLGLETGGRRAIKRLTISLLFPLIGI